jgi:crotonobetainyl-CoA hydratase
VLEERRGHVATLTLNRPEVLNAVDERLARELGEALERCRRDESVRAIVLAGAGRAFCAGHDLTAIAAGHDPRSMRHPEWGYAGIVRHRIDTPIVVAAQGYMLGAGLEIALSADVVVAAHGLRLGLPEVTRGLIAGAAGVPRLAQHVPPRIAAWLVYSGELIDADEAARWGLVNEVVAEDRLQDRAQEMAERIAANAPLAVQASKRLLRSFSARSTWGEDAWEELHGELDRVQRTADAAEGAVAFVARRAPRWTGS